MYINILIVTIILFIIITTFFNINIFESFSEYISTTTTSYNNIIDILKKNNIIFLKMKGCSHCSKQYDLLKNNNILKYFDVVDADTIRGSTLANTYRISGFPAFINNTSKKSVMGYNDDLNDLLKKLI